MAFKKGESGNAKGKPAERKIKLHLKQKHYLF